jgi:superfamily II DNA or RNA helicase
MPDPVSSGLSDTALQVAETFAVLYPERPARSRITSWLNKARATNNERALKADQIRVAIDELVAERLLTPSVIATRGVAAQGPGATLGNITWLCKSACDRGHGRVILDTFSESKSSPYPLDAKQYESQYLRLALIEGSADLPGSDDLEPYEMLWLTEPDALPYLQQLPDDLRQRACYEGLHYLVNAFQPIDEFLQTSKHYAPAFDDFTDLVALIYIIKGEFQAARDSYGELRSTLGERRDQIVGALSTEALIATLRGDDAAAIEHIRNAMEAERNGTRKRKVYPADYNFAISLFALVREASADSRALLSDLRKMKKSHSIAKQFDELFELAENARKPSLRRQPLSMHQVSITALLLAIATRWHNAYQPDATRTNYTILQRMFETASENGYAWVAAEALAVLEQAGMTSSLKPALIKNDSATLHQSLGTVSLTSLVQAAEQWEYSLLALEELASNRKLSAKGKNSTSKAETVSRLAWIIDADGEFYVEATPCEQKQNKAGDWSAGRPVSLKRLHEKSADIKYLLEQDRQAAQALDKHTSYNWHNRTIEYDVGERAMYRLIGHPYVFDADGGKIEVIDRPASLQIDTAANGLILSMQPRPQGSSPYLSRYRPDKQCLEVTHFSAAQLRIHDAIPDDDGLQVPLAARQRLLDLLASLAGDVAIQSDSQDSDTKQYQGDATPLLQLDFAGEALSVRLRVEPITETGTFFDAGEGGSVVYIKGPESTMQVLRDLALERELIQKLIAGSEVLTQVFDGRSVVLIDNTEQALELIDELQQSGVRCLWPGDVPLRVAARADSGQMHLSIKSAEQWFSASGELKYSEDDAMSLVSLLELMAQNPASRFVELSKGEFLALSKTLKSQLDALQSYASAQRKSADTKRIHPLATLALDPLLDSAQVEADKKWRDWRERVRNAHSASAQLPSTLEAELRPYQLEGFQWLARMGELASGACLADDMGLGKTVQTLTVLLLRAQQGPALVVAPTSVTANWMQEAQRFAPTLNLYLYGGDATERKQTLSQLGPFDLLVTSYGLLHNDIDDISQVQWHTAVLDEAQAIKNANTGRAKAARQLSAAFRIAATGTPIQNNLMDLHALFSFLNPGLLGSEASFRKTFALPIERDKSDTAREQLRALVSPFILRRNKRDVLKDLPARTDIAMNVELSPEEASLYEALRRTALARLEQSAERHKPGEQKLRVLAELMKLRRLCCNPKLIESDWSGPMSKLERFATTLAELLANRHKVLVFSQFVDHLKILEQHLKTENISYQYLDGSTPTKKRSERVAAFQAGDGDVFLISLTAGGTGLNLTAADYVIHMDPWWNPAVEDQASDRAHRIGQQRPVTIYRMVTTGTIEAQIQELHATKRDLADSLLAGTDSSRIDMEQLLGLLRE